MHLNPNNNFSQHFNLNNLTDEIDLIRKDIEEIELNLKSNYNQMIADITDFKSQLDFYLNTLKNCDQKIIFMLQSTKENETIANSLQDMRSKLENNKKQIELLLRMYELKTKIKVKKIQ